MRAIARPRWMKVGWPLARMVKTGMLAWLPVVLPSAAVRADYGWADSADFALDLLTVEIGPTGGWADSGDVALDLWPVNRGWADSGAVVVDCALGDVVILPSQQYQAEAKTLVLGVVATDTYWGPVTAGTFTWSLRDSGGVEQASGTLAYGGGGPGMWTASRAFAEGLAVGMYTVSYSLITDQGRTGDAIATLTVGSGTAMITGTIRDAADGSVLAGAEVACFGAVSAWQLANRDHGGIMPSLATLLAGLTPVRGPSTTGPDGRYEWADVPAGGPYLVVAAKTGYLDNHSDSFPVPTASSSLITKDLSLSLGSLNTLAAMSDSVETVYVAALAVMDRNAETMARLSQRVRGDAMLDDQMFVSELDAAADFIGDVAFVAGVLNVGYNLKKMGLYPFNRQTLATPMLKEAYKYMSVDILTKAVNGVRKYYLTPQLEAIYDEVVDEYRTMAADRSFPESTQGYQALKEYTKFQETLAAARSGYLSRAGAVTLPAGFSKEKARRLARELAGQANVGASQPLAFLYPADPALGVLGLTLPTAENKYLALSEQNTALLVGKQIFTVIEATGNVLTIAGTATTLLGGSGAVIGGVGMAVSLGGTAGDALVTAARVHVVEEMEATFRNAHFLNTADNAQAVQFFDGYITLLEAEAAQPKYLELSNRFAASTSVDLHLLSVTWGGKEYAYMFTLGIPGFDLAEEHATVTVGNTGATASEFRVTSYGFWSPLSIGDLFGVRSSGFMTSCEVQPNQGALALNPGQSVDLSMLYRGHSKNFLSQLKPHYLSVVTYSGPWQASLVTKPYWVFGLGEILFPWLPLTEGKKTVVAAEDSVVAPAVEAAGRMSLRSFLARAAGSTRLLEALLSADVPTVSANFVAEADLYAADLRLFAPSGRAVSIVVSDGQGRRLGYSAADGVTHNELPGSMTNMNQRPISLRLLDPAAGGSYTVEVALLSPGPDEVPITLFLELVSRSGAMMTAYPSSVILDADRGATLGAMVRIAEASGQQALTGVSATLGEIAKPGTGATLPFAGDLHKQVGDLPAGEQRYVSWDVSYPPDAQRGKYAGSATVTSSQTAELTVPVVALVRKATETVSVFEGPEPGGSMVQKRLTLGPDGKGQTWVHVPGGYSVVHATLGVVAVSAQLQDPSIDIGADGSVEWAFSGAFELGVFVSNIEGGFNAYLSAQPRKSEGIDVPILVVGTSGETILLNGIQLFLENDIPGDFDLDRDVDHSDFAAFEACISGPMIPHSGSETCQRVDLDDDSDVDQTDFAIFQRCYSGEGVLADPACAD